MDLLHCPVAGTVRRSISIVLVATAMSAPLCADTRWRQHSAKASQSSDVSNRSAGRVARDPMLNSGCVVQLSPQLSSAYELMVAGRLADAYAAFDTALKQAESDVSQDATAKACLMNFIGLLALQQASFSAAAESFRRGLALNPPVPSLVACLTSNLAVATFELGEIERAEETADRAVRLSAQAFGPGHTETLFAQATLAAIHVMRGDSARAQPVFRRILSEVEKTWGVSSYEASVAASNLAVAYLADQQYERARSLLERSVETLTSNPGRAVHELAMNQASLALAFAGTGRRRNAQFWIDRAVGTAERDLGSAHPCLPAVLERTATASFLIKDHGMGRQRFEQAVALLGSLYGQSSPLVRDALGRYADLLRFAKDKAGARDVEDRRRGFTP